MSNIIVVPENSFSKAKKQKCSIPESVSYAAFPSVTAAHLSKSPPEYSSSFKEQQLKSVAHAQAYTLNVFCFVR